MKVPFNLASISDIEQGHVLQALRGGHLAGDGPFTKKVQSFLELKLNVRRALLTSSCTDALEACGLLLDLQEDDEVLMPSYTFVSTANAFVLRGAKPRFVDIRPDTKNIDESLIEARITAKTKAIVVVHYAGVACAMDPILGMARKHGLKLIEDNAHGIFGSYKGRPLGSLGDLATLSFHETKNFTSGEGGALLVNDPQYVERAEIIREKGTNRSLFFKGQVDKYTWVDVGSSYLPSDLNAALLWAQFERFAEIQNRRRKIWNLYFELFSQIQERSGFALPIVPDEAEQAYHNFYLVLSTASMRTAFIEHMRKNEVSTAFHYVPLNTSKMGRRLDPDAFCPVSESMGDCLVRLPFYSDLQSAQIEKVFEAAQSFSF